jgi:flavin-dependent dehydrogenase
MSKNNKHYDCIIMGAGFAGNCMARHLMLKIPGIKVALIDPRSEDRGDQDLKVGESMVEIAALFLTKELGLHNYMIENHPPKAGLNFHWPKDPARTETIDDYYHLWQGFYNQIPQFQMNRAKLERDLLRMNKEMGVDFYNGHVIDIDLTPGDESHSVKVRTADETLTVTGLHLVDASGRRFLIGKRTNNLITEHEDIFRVANASSWVRVRNFDRNFFDHGHHPNRTVASFYYATNHFCGHGHWIWVIPSAIDLNEISIGVVYHKDKIDKNAIDRQDKLLSFLENNHNLLYKLIESGEIVDFYWRPQLAYRSKCLFSRDNWYVIGDAAFIFDALYSIGTSSITLLIEAVTEIIRAKRAGEADAEEKRDIYNQFNLATSEMVNGFFRGMTDTLGNASIMSWRVYIEAMLWFGMLVPMYAGRWNLDKEFLRRTTPMLREINTGLLEDIYADLCELARDCRNIGFADATRTDSIIKNYLVAKVYDDYIINSRFEPRHTNVFKAMKFTNLYAMVWYSKLQWRAGGMSRLLGSKSIRNLARMSKYAFGATVGDVLYRLAMRGVPSNTEVHRAWREFQTYQYRPYLQPWQDGRPEPSVKREMPRIVAAGT